jgi:hypothetical protein
MLRAPFTARTWLLARVFSQGNIDLTDAAANGRRMLPALHSLITDFKEGSPTEVLYSERLDALTPCPLCGSDYVVEFFVSSGGGLIQY